MNQHFDALVFGAGPAGSAAGIGLANAGMRVLIVELSEFPRHRPGETLHPGLEPLFEKLGVNQSIEDAGFHRFSGQRVHWGEQPEFAAFGRDEVGNWLGYQAPREILDALLLERARAVGCQVWQPCRVTGVHRASVEPHYEVTTDLGSVSSDWLFDATGRSQLLTRCMGLQWTRYSRQLIARYGYVESRDVPIDEPKRAAPPSLRRDALGWTWLAELNENKTAWVRLRFDGLDPGEGWLPEELRDSQVVQASRGADVTHRIAQQTAGTRWFLLGDAACVLDPASSHGLLRAIMTGMQAAHLAACARLGQTTTRTVATAYHQWVTEWFHSDLNKLQELYANAPVTEAVQN